MGNHSWCREKAAEVLAGCGQGAAGAPKCLQPMNPASCLGRKSILTLHQRLHAPALRLPKQNKAWRVPPAPALCAGSLKIIIKQLGLLGLCWKSNTWEKPWRKRAPAALLLTPHRSLPPLTQRPSSPRAPIQAGSPQGMSPHISIMSPAPRRALLCQSQDMGTGSTPGKEKLKWFEGSASEGGG